jgi:hypothetical protein
MRWLIAWTAIFGSTVFFGGSLFAQQSMTVNGVTYTDAELIQEYPQSVYISHADGRTFINKMDLTPEHVEALGVTRPVTDAFQEGLDRDLREFREGQSYEDRPEQQPVITADEIRARAAQRQREAAIERAERDRQNLARPREPKTLSPLASQEEKEAYRARQVMQAIERGEATVADLPEDYGGRPTGNSSRAVTARKAWDRNQAIEMENRLIAAGRITEAAALRQMRLQQEGNESLEKLAKETERLRQDIERIDRERRLRGY